MYISKNNNIPNYTIHGDPAVNYRIHNDLDLITKSIVNILGQEVKGILLTGGFGRGEGSVIFENGKIRPLNDYDIEVVVGRLRHPKSVHKDMLNTLAAQLADIIGIKQIDIHIVNKWHLAVPVYTVARYEMKHGHKILFGRDISIMACSADKIPLTEGTRYFLSRGSGLLIARLLLDLGLICPGSKDYENFFIEMIKAGLAMGDASLIMKGCYHFSYNKRIDLIDIVDIHKFSKHEIFREIYVECLKEKLRPNISKYFHCNPEKWWHDWCEVFLEFFRFFEGQRLKKRVVCWREYGFDLINTGYPHWLLLLRRVKNVFTERTLNSVSHPPASQFLGMMALLLWCRIEGNDKGVLSIIAKCLGLSNLQQKEWLKLWQQVTVAYLRRWHPQGIVTKFNSEP